MLQRSRQTKRSENTVYLHNNSIVKLSRDAIPNKHGLLGVADYCNTNDLPTPMHCTYTCARQRNKHRLEFALDMCHRVTGGTDRGANGEGLRPYVNYENAADRQL